MYRLFCDRQNLGSPRPFRVQASHEGNCQNDWSHHVISDDGIRFFLCYRYHRYTEAIGSMGWRTGDERINLNVIYRLGLSVDGVRY